MERSGATPLDLAVPAGTLGIRIAKEPPATAGPKLAVRVATRSGARHGTLAPLPGSRAEVEAIAKAYQHARPDAEVRILLGPDATEAGLVAAVPGARILHLATHGLVDEGGSASFSALALTKPRLPVPGDDGFLTFADLLGRWRARLKHTELVVLSACDSQRGRLEADEGMLSLPLGFSFAGCPRVIGSLWRVDDEATALLMASFYRRWLASPQAGAAAALQAARRELKQNHPDPHHWAPFVLLGDAR
ncbi:MAG: CHAT domain-containing protein [Planctomycetota bacterium]|nr:CHAT domain-containing protein [Planctomycetota bacterium]